MVVLFCSQGKRKKRKRDNGKCDSAEGEIYTWTDLHFMFTRWTCQVTDKLKSGRLASHLLQPIMWRETGICKSVIGYLARAGIHQD
jgi:hypothetical protein